MSNLIVNSAGPMPDGRHGVVLVGSPSAVAAVQPLVGRQVELHEVLEFTPSVERVRDRIAFGGPRDEEEIASGVIDYIDSVLAGLPDATARRATWPLGFTQAEYLFSDNPGPALQSVACIAGRRDALWGIMAEFWMNNLVPGHKAIGTGGRLGSLQSLISHYHEHALGNFEGLLKRFVGSVPLIYFMNNQVNVAGALNENLGREILELFALGIADPDEAPRYDPIIDVEELSRVLTGWNVRQVGVGERVDNDPAHVRGSGTDGSTVYANGVFTHNRTQESAWFYPERHDGDPAFFTFWPGVEFSTAVDGNAPAGYGMHPSLDKFLTMIARHRPAARYQCRKIGRLFIGRDPTPRVRDMMVDTFMDNVDEPDQIARVLRVLFRSEDFCGPYADDRRALTPMVFWSKFVNYFGDRAGGMQPVGFGNVATAGRLAGAMRDEFYSTGTYQSPDGYPDEATYWLSPAAMTARAENAQAMITRNLGGSGDFNTNLPVWAAQRGFQTPRDFVEDVAHFWRLTDTTALLALFASPDTAVSDWAATPIRTAMQDALRTVMLTSNAHMAA